MENFKHKFALKIIFASCVFLFGLFSLTSFAQAALLTCGGDKSEADCVAAGGTVVVTGGCTSCSISGSTCPSGMIQYLSWTYYTSKTCGSVLHLCEDGNCGEVCINTTSCTTQNSSWLNTTTNPECSYRVDYDHGDYYPSCTYCEDMSGDLCDNGDSDTYDASCTNVQSAGCAVSRKYYKYFETRSKDCLSEKSKVACIGSGAIPPSLVNGVCGTRNKTYDSTVIAWPATDTSCVAGTSNPLSPVFPAAGATTSWACVGSGGGSTASCSASKILEEDCGLRIFDGAAIVKAACEPVGSTTSLLRIGKNGVVRGIILVDIADPKASSVRMKTASGIKVIKKL